MVVSSGSALMGAIGEIAALTSPKTCEAFGRLNPMPWKLNKTGTLVSERVHLREIVVIPGVDYPAGDPPHFACSLAVP
jgi:hypothetical protein